MNPSTPTGTVTMLATVCPARSVLADDTVGIVEPVGQTDAYPAPSTSTIVRLSTTACTAPGATAVAAATAWVTGASDIERPAASRLTARVGARVEHTDRVDRDVPRRPPDGVRRHLLARRVAGSEGRNRRRSSIAREDAHRGDHHRDDDDDDDPSAS